MHIPTVNEFTKVALFSSVALSKGDCLSFYRLSSLCLKEVQVFFIPLIVASKQLTLLLPEKPTFKFKTSVFTINYFALWQSTPYSVLLPSLNTEHLGHAILTTTTLVMGFSILSVCTDNPPIPWPLSSASPDSSNHPVPTIPQPLSP